jgi:hypothetical protein
MPKTAADFMLQPSTSGASSGSTDIPRTPHIRMDQAKEFATR